MSDLTVTIVDEPDVIGVVGKSVTLMCNKSTDDPVSWWYLSSPDAQVQYITHGGPLLNGYKERCRLDGDNLIFNTLERNDTGTFTCLEKAGYGVRHVMSLNVTGRLI